MGRASLILVAMLAGGTVAGCGGADAHGGTDPGRVLSVAEAMQAADGRQVTVRGYILIRPDETSQLCAGLAGSYPPQCGQPALPLRSLDPAALTRVESAEGIRWTGEIVLRGTIAHGILTEAHVG